MVRASLQSGLYPMNEILARAIRAGRAVKHIGHNIPIRDLNKSIPIPVTRLKPDPKPFVPAPEQKYPPIKEIIRVVAEYYGVPEMCMISNRRTVTVVHPRHVAIYLARELTPHSFPMIGRAFSGRDHTTCLHACRKIEKLIQCDEKTRLEVESIKQRLVSSQPLMNGTGGVAGNEAQPAGA